MRYAKPLCTLLLAFAAITSATAATNRTTRLGEMDADAPLLRLLDSASASVETTVYPIAMGSVLPGAVLTGDGTDRPVLTAGVDDSEMWLMLLVAGGLVAFHLRRKQKSLQHRPLSEAVYR